MNYFKCVRCNKVTIRKCDMQKHLSRKTKCQNINSINLNNDEIYEKSIIPNDIHIEGMIVPKEKEKKTNIKKCELCDKVFSSRSALLKHIKTNINCKELNKIIENTIIGNNNNQININGDNNTIITNPTINNQMIVNNPTVNININVPNKIVGFDEDWDVSDIDTDKIISILMNKHKFTGALGDILSNTKNVNVIIKNNDVGLVYKSKNNKYEAMSKEELMEKSIKKLYKHLNCFYKTIKENELYNFDINTLTRINKDITIAYQRYFYQSDVFRNSANNAILYFYNSFRDIAIENYNNAKVEENNDVNNNDDNNNNIENNNNLRNIQLF